MQPLTHAHIHPPLSVQDVVAAPQFQVNPAMKQKDNNIKHIIRGRQQLTVKTFYYYYLAFFGGRIGRDKLRVERERMTRRIQIMGQVVRTQYLYMGLTLHQLSCWGTDRSDFNE